MNILFVADGRSPIAMNWIEYFVQKGHEVHLVSTFPCKPATPLISLHILPVAFSGTASTGQTGTNTTSEKRVARFRKLTTPRNRTLIRQWLGPFTLGRASRKLKEIIQNIQPDLIHAKRVPFEGMLAALADPHPPLLISVWGNDFTLHAPSTPLMGYHTRRALRRANALHTDCHRDVTLAYKWGFGKSKPNTVLPGAGGVQSEVFFPPDELSQQRSSSEGFTIIQPRGFRAYVHNEAFFRAIPFVLAKHPNTRLICPAMAGEPQAEGWVQELGISQAVTLLPKMPRNQMAELFRSAQIAVSPTSHDGTPNTLLEAMACGCFPVAGDIESLREWITSRQNGLLVNPKDSHATAGAMIEAIENPELRLKAVQHNLKVVAARASYEKVMPEAEAFYQFLVKKDRFKSP
jgi:glycosyltransferase involved in cell wall biosynthesis